MCLSPLEFKSCVKSAGNSGTGNSVHFLTGFTESTRFFKYPWYRLRRISRNLYRVRHLGIALFARGWFLIIIILEVSCLSVAHADQQQTADQAIAEAQKFKEEQLEALRDEPHEGALIPEKPPILNEEEEEKSGQGLQPAIDTLYWKRLLAIHSYEGDRWIYQDVRRNTLWELKPWATYAWRYDSNILQTQNNHIADWYQTLEAGLHFNLGKIAGSPDDLDSIFALETNYSLSQDWFLNNADFDALNQKGRIDLRIGREALVFRPYFDGNHVTGISSLASERAARFTSTNLTAGTTIDQALTPTLNHHMDYSWGQIDMQDHANVGYELWRVYHELNFALQSNEGHALDARYTSEDSVFTWGSAQNASSNDRTAEVHYLLGGVGARGLINSSFTYNIKCGWENIERGWESTVGRDLSTFYFDSSLRYDYNRHFLVELFLERNYQLAQTNADDNYIDTNFSIGPVFRFDPGWQISPTFTLGTTSSEQDEKTLYFVPATEVDYILTNRTKFKVKVEYDETRTIRGTGGDIIGVRSTVAVGLVF